MSIVFDEVIASVEAPPSTTPSDTAQSASMKPEKEDKNIIRIIETQQRWANRLMAD